MNRSKHGFTKPSEVIQKPKTEEELQAERKAVISARFRQEVRRIGPFINELFRDMFDGRYPKPIYYDREHNPLLHNWRVNAEDVSAAPYFYVYLSYRMSGEASLSIRTNCLNDWFHREHPEYQWPTHKQDAKLLVRLIEQFTGYSLIVNVEPDPAIARREYEAGAEERSRKAEQDYRRSIGIEEEYPEQDHSTDPAYNLP